MKFIYLNAAIFSIEEIREIVFFEDVTFVLKDGSERHCDTSTPNSVIENEILEFFQNQSKLLDLNQVRSFWLYEQLERSKMEENANPES
jgi:hypothetical protein